MPAPRIEVINAIFDSYLTMRKTTWGSYNETTKEIKRPDEKKAGKKFDLVVNFIKTAKECKTTEDWVKFSATLYSVELEEKNEYNDRSFLVKPFLWQLLEHTLQAMRAYIYSQIKNEQYTSTPELQGYMSHAEARNETYQEEFFQTFIRKEDHRGLGEKSFNDFVGNVMRGVRTLSLVELLLPSAQPPLTAVAFASSMRKSRQDADAADALRAAEAKRREAGDRSAAISKLLSEAEQNKDTAAAESSGACTDSRAQQTYAEVAARHVAASSSSSDAVSAASARPVRSRRGSTVTFSDGHGPTLFSGVSLRSSVAAPAEQASARETTTSRSGVRRRRAGGGI